MHPTAQLGGALLRSRLLVRILSPILVGGSFIQQTFVIGENAMFWLNSAVTRVCIKGTNNGHFMILLYRLQVRCDHFTGSRHFLFTELIQLLCSVIPRILPRVFGSINRFLVRFASGKFWSFTVPPLLDRIVVVLVGRWFLQPFYEQRIWLAFRQYATVPAKYRFRSSASFLCSSDARKFVHAEMSFHWMTLPTHSPIHIYVRKYPSYPGQIPVVASSFRRKVTIFRHFLYDLYSGLILILWH